MPQLGYILKMISQTSSGLKEECASDTLSPKVFTTAMEEIFKKLNLQERGLNVDGERLTDLRFADDVALITTSVKDMEVHLNNLNIESKKIGLKIHRGKTKYMTNYQSEETIMVEKEEIDKMDRYKYLGQTIMLGEHTREEVLIRIKAGWSCFGRYKDILCDPKLPMCIRRRMYNQCVIPTNGLWC
ncbi:endonuclease-reverse transcriptase [Apostichopus japonicus]|uniref:Endonuclease-reverse transcriptase n=1 Tax=Stichopus japonicus TaxID=307972 RepID=A0A2G8KF77_STIJA|nr:endonuclease-reverse transcriptase [Apostichopus japonicus]